MGVSHVKVTSMCILLKLLPATGNHAALNLFQISVVTIRRYANAYHYKPQTVKFLSDSYYCIPSLFTVICSPTITLEAPGSIQSPMLRTV